ncbi:MAG: AAA family ATPase, partial [Armatimonadota bacterium]
SLAALITTGEVWPDGTRSTAGSVVLWSGEDGIADTLVPRLVAMSADMEKIFFVSGKGGSTFDPSKDLPLLAAQIKTVPDVKLVIVDPVVSAIGGDSHKNAEVRKGLQPLVDLGRDTGACIVGISHFNKSGGSTANPLDLVTGSIAFAAVARVVLGAAKLAAPEEGGHSRIFCRIKSNIGPDEDGVGYDLRMEFLNGRPEIEASVVTWGDYIKGHSRDLLSQVVEQKPNSALASAQEWLQKILADGPMPTTDVESAAERAGMSWSTVRRAKYGLGIRVCKDSDKVFGVWRWQLA